MCYPPDCRAACRKARRLVRPRSNLTGLALALLARLGWFGQTSSHDPTRNPLVVFVSTVFRIINVLAHGLTANLWLWLNPWIGGLHLFRQAGF